MGLTYLALAIVSFTRLGITYKLVDRHKQDPARANLFMFAAAGLVSLIWAWLQGPVGSLAPAIGLGVAMSAIVFPAVLAFRAACDKGEIWLSWTVLNLPMAMPVLAGMQIWHEMPKPVHYIGFALTAVSILLLGLDMKETSK